jgi:hypothetical protein
MAEEIFADRLMSGEHIVWSGRPGQGIIFMPRDAFNIPVSLLLLGFFIYGTILGTHAGAPGFPWFGYFVICIALYWSVGRFLVDAWIRHNMRYAVTNRRVLFDRPWPYNGSFTDVTITELLDISLIKLAGGRGTILLGPLIPMMDNRFRQTWISSLDPTPLLVAIDDARNVCDLIQRLRSDSRKISR